LFPVLSGQISTQLGRGEHTMAHRSAEDLLRLAETRGDSASLMVANRSMGYCLHLLGDFAGAVQHFERVPPLYDPQFHRAIATVAAFDLRAAAQAIMSWSFLLLGRPQQGLTQVEEALEWGRQLNHPHTLLYMLTATALFHRLRRDEEGGESAVQELLRLAAPQNLRLWLSPANVLRGRGLVARGEIAAGLELAREGIAEKRAQGTLANMTFFLGLMAECCDAAGEPDEAEGLLIEALKLADATEERWFEAELHRLSGDSRLRHRAAETDDAEACFHQSLAIARGQGARWWELRTAVSLARLWNNRGKSREARDLLAPIIGSFAEGFDTFDLKEASRLLGELEDKFSP
jgi:predicted ATPase